MKPFCLGPQTRPHRVPVINYLPAVSIVVLALIFAGPSLAQTPVAAAPSASESAKPSAPGPKKSGKSARKPVHINPTSAVKIVFDSPLLDQNNRPMTSGSIIMRETASGKLLQIHLVQDEDNPNALSGKYSISWQNLEKLKVEFYVPPQGLLDSNEGMKKVAAMIANNQLPRNPFILRLTPNGAQTVEIFENREKAQAALATYQAQQEQLQGIENQKFPSDQAMATKELADKLKLAQIAGAAEVERLKMGQLEEAKLAKMRADEAAQSEAERARRRDEAANTAAEGLALFRKEQFPEAVAKFAKALELDPENHSIYFQYGVALFKIEDFNKSLVYLRLADGSQVSLVERDFFIGLNLFRLKEYDAAAAAFETVAKTGDQEMASPANYYSGVSRYEQKKWDEAKAKFQIVLDTTKDPQLDKRSEQYVEQILRIQQFELERSRKWQLSATVGEQYDSNVNLNSNSALSQGSVTYYDGYRTLLIGSGRYRPIYQETREFAMQIDVLTMYTTNNSTKYNQTLRNADPTVLTLSAPYTHKGLLLEKGYKFDITPGVESIAMSVEDNVQKQIISSGFLNLSNLLIMSERLYSNFNLEMRHDQNQLASQFGDNDSTAYKIRLVNSNLHFVSEDKSKIVTSEVDYTVNTASGKNSTYNRFDLAVGYLQPVKWNVTANAKLGYFYLNYPLKSDNRTDNSYTMTLGGSKKLSDIYSTGLVGTYNINQSNSDTSYSYNKWTVMLTFSALYAF